MRPSFLPLLVLCLGFTRYVNSNNNNLSFYNCSQILQWEVMVYGGAVVTSNGSLGTDIAKSTCSLTLKTTPSSTFLVQLIEFSFSSEGICKEHLTLLDLGNGEKLLDATCNLTSKLPVRWTTSGSQLQAIFVRNSTNPSGVHPPSTFKLIITSIKSTCSKHNFWCSKFCINSNLLCDNVPHCPEAEDERLCTKPASVPPYPPLGAPTTVQPLNETTPDLEKDSLYLWLPLIVVVAFTIIMLTLIMIGRRATNCATSPRYSTTNNEVAMVTEHRQAVVTTAVAMATTSTSPVTTEELPIDSENLDIITVVLVAVVFVIVLVACLILGFREQRHRNNEHQINEDLRIDVNSNPGFTDGAPATPPPTYSMIERQTSYVSNISQTSSQLSIPPDYNDVVDPDEIIISNRRRRINSARSNSSSSRRNRPRHFQRSLSAQDAHIGRTRFPSDRSDPTMNVHSRMSSLSDTDSVFIEPSSIPARDSNSSQTPLANLTEVDETLGNSTILSDVGEQGGPPNYRNHNENHLTPAVIIAQPRPLLQRSISDITDSNTVNFSLGD